jgi:hypothetical protein
MWMLRGEEISGHLLDQQLLFIAKHHIFFFFLLMKSRQKIAELLLIFEENSTNLGRFLRICNEDLEDMKSPPRR